MHHVCLVQMGEGEGEGEGIHFSYFSKKNGEKKMRKKNAREKWEMMCIKINFFENNTKKKKNPPYVQSSR